MDRPLAVPFNRISSPLSNPHTYHYQPPTLGNRLTPVVPSSTYLGRVESIIKARGPAMYHVFSFFRLAATFSRHPTLDLVASSLLRSVSGASKTPCGCTALFITLSDVRRDATRWRLSAA